MLCRLNRGIVLGFVGSNKLSCTLVVIVFSSGNAIHLKCTVVDRYFMLFVQREVAQRQSRLLDKNKGQQINWGAHEDFLANLSL